MTLAPKNSLIIQLILLLPLAGIASTAKAEGSWQFGLSEGLTHSQPVFSYDNSYVNDDTGLEAELRPLYVDLLSDNEVINISLCAASNGADVGFEIWDRDGTSQLHSWSSANSNVSCSDSFTGNLTGAASFAPGAAGTYQVRLRTDGDNESGVFNRFDITVTSGAATSVNPRTNQGRLWAYRWAFRCTAPGANTCYEDDYSTSANLYAVVDGGFTDTFYVWQLDLSSFAGFAYEITANSTGLESPNPDGTVVAGLSACIDTDDDPSNGCSSVSGNRNNVAAVYPIYTSSPALTFSRPTQPPTISNFRFLDDQDVDDSISPNVTLTVQDTGNFKFATNLVTQGTYTITIDLTQDGTFGAGDVLLNGIALPGDNSVNWNGRDNSGVPIPDGSYNAAIILKTGEFHFTAADAETSGTTAPNDGLTINAVLDGGTLDTSNKVYWDDHTVLQLTNATSYNGDGTYRYHQWGNFTGSGDGNRAYIDTYVIGDTSAPVITRFEVEPSDTPKTRLLGTIFEDSNGDGVRNPGEPGISNAVVAIVENGITYYASTDEDGNYEFFTRAASVVVDVDEASLPPGYVRTAGVDGETVTVTPGIDNNLGLDGYRNTLADVTGQLRDDADGDGDLADADAGIGGATVQLFSDPNGDGDPSDGLLVDTVLTGSDGSYTFANVAEGNFVVVVTDPAGFSATGDADGVSDSQVAITRAGGTPALDIDFLVSVLGSSIDIAANAVCINDVPYVQYDITAVNFDATGKTAKIEWIDSDGTVVRTDNNQPLNGGQLLWPEAAIDGAGNGVAWPGWEFTGGQWVEIPSLVRPNVTVRISVNPTSQVTLAYPPATPDCVASPLGAPSLADPAPAPDPAPSAPASGTNQAQAIPTIPLPLFALMIASMGLIGGLRIHKVMHR